MKYHCYNFISQSSIVISIGITFMLYGVFTSLIDSITFQASIIVNSQHKPVEKENWVTALLNTEFVFLYERASDNQD